MSGRERPAFKRTRFLWLKNPWNLELTQRRRLSALCRLNLPIVRADLLKDEFQRFWKYVRSGWAERHLRHWLGWAMRSWIQPMKRFARMIKTTCWASSPGRAYGSATVRLKGWTTRSR
jgi:transposase